MRSADETRRRTVEDRAAMCIGKQPFLTFDLARGVGKARGLGHKDSKRGREPYKCRFCGLWHIGKKYNNDKGLSSGKKGL